MPADGVGPFEDVGYRVGVDAALVAQAPIAVRATDRDQTGDDGGDLRADEGLAPRRAGFGSGFSAGRSAPLRPRSGSGGG